MNCSIAVQRDAAQGSCTVHTDVTPHKDNVLTKRVTFRKPSLNIRCNVLEFAFLETRFLIRHFDNVPASHIKAAEKREIVRVCNDGSMG